MMFAIMGVQNMVIDIDRGVLDCVGIQWEKNSPFELVSPSAQD